MNTQNQILSQLNWRDAGLEALLSGEVEIIYNYGDIVLVDEFWYPHPPILFPLFIESPPLVKGLSVFPFSNRESSVICFDLATNFFYENARTPDQLKFEFLIQLLEGIRPDDDEYVHLVEFAQQIGYSNFAELQYFFDNEYDGTFLSYEKLAVISSKRPLQYCVDKSLYTGEFASNHKGLNFKAFPHVFSFEVMKREWINEVPNAPAWLLPGADTQALFWQYLEEKNYANAWLALNSDGWRMQEIAVALEALSNQANNELCSLVAKNWLRLWAKWEYLYEAEF